MDAGDVKGQISRGLAWTGVASSIVGTLDTLANFLILAYWIAPEQQGVAAAAIWLFPILDMIIDGGLSAAIVQRGDLSVERLSTIFWINLTLSMCVSVVVVALGGPITGSDTAGLILGFYGLKLLFQNVFFVPQALMRRELRFRSLSLIRVGANVLAFATKVGTAAAGAGAWAYLYGNFSHALVTGIAIQALQPFRPRFVLALRDTVKEIRFGVATALREILFNFYTNVDYRVVIAFFGREANGLYYFAYMTLLYPVRYISLVVIEVAFPAFSRLRGDRERVIDQFVAFTRMNLVTVLPFVAFIAIQGDDFVRVIFGERWLPAVTAMRLLSVVGVLRAMSFVMPPLLEGLGKPRRSLAYAVCASIVMPALYLGAAIVFGPRYGWYSVALAWVVGFPVVFVVLLWLSLTAIGLSAVTYVRRTIGIPLCVAVAAAVAWAVRHWLLAGATPLVRLAVVGVVFLVLTLGLLARFQGITPRFVLQSLRGRKEG